MTTLPVLAPQHDCWNRIGVRGDRSCPELATVGHCHNCPVFAAAGRRFLDGPCPEGYLEEWTQGLAAPVADAASDLHSVLIFRLGDEWLALPVPVLVEVTPVRPVHRVPFRGGALAGLVNIRGELHLCVSLGQLMGITAGPAGNGPAAESPARPPQPARMLVVRRQADRWVLPVDEVDQVHRFSAGELTKPPATVSRAAARLTRGVFAWKGRAIGYLDETRLFEVLRTNVR
jgi:chemotaxis-related protein WspD